MCHNAPRTWVTIEICTISSPDWSFKSTCREAISSGVLQECSHEVCKYNAEPQAYQEQTNIVQPALLQSTHVCFRDSKLHAGISSCIVLMLCRAKMQHVSLQRHINHVLHLQECTRCGLFAPHSTMCWTARQPQQTSQYTCCIGSLDTKLRLIFSESPKCAHDSTRPIEIFTHDNRSLPSGQSLGVTCRSVTSMAGGILRHLQESICSSAWFNFRANRQLNNLSAHPACSMFAQSIALAPRYNG